MNDVAVPTTDGATGLMKPPHEELAGTPAVQDRLKLKFGLGTGFAITVRFTTTLDPDGTITAATGPNPTVPTI